MLIKTMPGQLMQPIIGQLTDTTIDREKLQDVCLQYMINLTSFCIKRRDGFR